MPRMPGRGSTRKTVDFDNIQDAGVQRFVYVWEHEANRPCAITGCEHWVSGAQNPDWKYGGAEGDMPWKTCGEGNAAGMVYDKTEKAGNHTQYIICVCHVNQLGEQRD